METTRKTMKKRVRRNRYALAKAAVSFACLIAILGGMILESLPMPVAYSLESALICGKQEHVHGDGCWTQQLVCTEENHEHSDACYENTLTCGYEEHIHSAGCYAAIEATAAVQEEPAEAPVQADEPATPEKQEKPAPTPAETPAPTPAETPAPEETATLEPAMEETTAPTQTTEPTSEATAEPTAEAELVLKNLTISSATAKAGESVRWGFECANAEKITYAIFDAAGAQAASGEVSAEHVIEWTATAAGVYTIVVIAVRGDQQAQLEGSIQVEAVASDALAVSAHSEQRYAFAGKDALVFDTSVSGGAAPVDVEYELRVNDQTVYTHSGFEAQISYMPQEFGVHTLTMTATDANGQQASATYSIPVAVEEREHASDWERTFANVKLTGNFAKDILAIARTQLGYAERERDFIIDEDDVQHGYTRYGAWYGASYSEWCAMFVSFCAHYAQIPEKYLPQAANCAKWKKNLDKLYLDDEDSYAPEAGDLIFFHYNRTEDQRPESEKEKNVPNHVGIVTGTDKNYIYTIEGNSANRVRECRYEWGDEHIVGYVSMAEIMRLANPETATPAETKAPAEPEAPGETAASTETVAPTATKAPFDGAAYVRIVGRSVNLRAEASVDSESLGHANQDDLFRVDGQVENEIGEIWYCVFYGESFAYVRSDLAEAHEATVGTDEQLPGIDENLPSVDEEFPRIDGNLPGADEEVPNAEHKFQRFDYNSEIPDGFTQTESGLLYNLEDEALEPEERVYLVYGRYGEGEARLYFCDQFGTPMGEEMYFVPAIVMAGGGQQDSVLTVSVKANKPKYTSADNIVSLTIKVKSKKNDSLPKGKNLRITLSGDLSDLRYINASVEDNTDIEWAGSASGNVIYLKPSNNVGTGTVVIKCSYKIKEGTAHSVRTISVQAYDEAKKYEGSADASYEYAKAEGVCVSSVSVPTTVVAPGETVMGTVHLANYNDSEQIVTKLVVKDASGSVVCTQENLSVTVPGNSGSGEVAFSFVAPAGKYGNADYTVEVTYGEDSANTGNFTITLPADPKLSIANTVSVSYRTNDEAYFSAMRVKVTDNSSSADNKRNEKNAGSIQMRTANGDWTTVASIAQSSKINIKDGNFAFDLNGKVTPDEVLNNLFRVELTVANDKGLSTPYPQSEWFYLTDSLPKAGFREWVLNPENGYLNDGTFNGDMDALAEAYKKYSRLGLTVTSESVTGEAGQTATLPVRVKSDEAMTSNGVIEISLSDSTVEGKIVFDGCAGQSGFGNVSINAKGNLELALNQLLEAGTEAVVNVTVPLGYETAIGEHTVDIDAKYRGSSYGEVEKQAQGTGTIVVTAAMGWHILSVESPSGAVMPGGNVTYALKIRNFDTKSVELKAVQAALEGTALEIVGMRLADGTEISLDNPSIVLPAASGEGDAYVPGDVTLQLRVTAPGTAMSNKTVDFTALDAEGHPEPAKGTLTVVKPTLTIKPVVDYDPFTKAVTVKLVAENAGSPSGAYTWQNLDTRDAYADWETIATTGSNGELTLTGDHLTELEAFGADSAKLQYRLIDASGDTVYAMSNAAAFENLPQLMKAVEVVAELAEHYGYSYANFRKLIDNLYYVEVAKDGGVPFSDANSLMLYLQSCYDKGGISSAVKAWEKYRYDLYDPNLWPTRNRSTQEGSAKPYRDNVPDDYDFGDLDMNWEKDDKNGQPFHSGTASKVVAAKETNSGYFSDLKKTASAVKNGDENTERRYIIDLMAKADGKVMVPAAMVFQIQTSWQLFDLDHANGVNGVKGSPCSVTSMATLYDIKHGMIDFAEWLRENSDGSIMFAITDVEHKGSYSAISAPYFTNDSDALIDALEGWDVFGNCEHVHYTQTAYTNAMNALQSSGNFAGWTGMTADGEVDLYPYAKKIAVVIGGSTENSNGGDGYGCVLTPGNMDYLYTIRTNSGSGILSWLDNSSMTSLVKQYNGVAYKDVNTRTKVFETLKSIVQDYQTKVARGAITNVELTDTITDEFDFVPGSARIVKTNEDGTETETKVSVTTTTEKDADGRSVTRVTYKPASVTLGETLHLRFDVVAKEDYIGSNNVYTNEGKATLSYTNSLLGNTSYKLEFEQEPQVNVPIRYEIEDGGEVTIGTGAAVDLWSLGETIVKEMAGDKAGIEDWSVRYDQINGNVTYQWMKNVGTEENPIYEPVSEPSAPVHVTNGVPDGNGFASLNHTFTSNETGDFPFVLKTTFTPDKKSDTWSGVNDGEVSELTQYGKVMVHVVKATDIHVLKVDAADAEKKLEGAVFTLNQHGEALTFADLGNGNYAFSKSGTTELITAADGRLNITGLPNGEYTLCEIKAPNGYAANAGSVTFATKNGTMTQTSATDEHWTCDTDTLTITLENEVWTEPTPTPEPEPTPTPPFIPIPTPPAAGNETSVTVRKTWSDEGDKDSKRPVSITVQLQMNGKLCGEPVTLTKEQADGSGDWVYTWKDLPFKDETGAKIEYSVIEDEHGEGMQWYDARYGEVEVIEGIEAGTHWLEADLQSGRYAIYSESVNGLLKEFDSSGKNAAASAMITGYNVKYDKVYDSELKEPAASAQWEFIEVNGVYQIRNISSGKYLTVGSKKNLTCASEAGSAVWRISNGKFSVTYPKDKNGNTETKYLKMEDKEGGKVSLDGNSNNATTFTFYREIAIAGRNDAYLRRITNVYKNPNATTEVVVKKVWANNGAYLHVNDSVTVTLYQNGTPMLDDDGNPRTLILNAANGWTDTFAELPCYRVIDESTAEMEKYVYSVYETAAPAGYKVSGEGEASYVITNPETGEGHYEVTITNTRDTTGYEPKKPDTSVHKRIDYLGDGGVNSDTTLTGDDNYRLYLDFTGASEPIDVLFVIDTTGSMTQAMGSGDKTPRQTVVSNLMNGTNGNMGYLDQVATMNSENNVAVMLFSGPEWGESVTGSKYPYESNKQDCQYIMLDWTSGGNRLGSRDYTNRKSGTYYDPAIMRAREMFGDSKVANNGHRKIMIFITDGEPNGYIGENLCYQYSTSSSERKAHILQAMADFRKDFPTIETYTIGISSDIDGVKDLLTSMAGSSSRFFSAYSGDEMMNALEKVMDGLKPHDLSITDSLSAYVALNAAQPDLKVTRTNRSTGEVVTVWQGSAVGADGSIGSAVSGYENIVQSVKYTPSQAEDSTGTITATFNPELHVDSQYTYTLSYNVKATNAAYQYTDANAVYPGNGDANTDYGDNATSSGQPGLRSNKEAKADYTASGKSWHDDYPHPVIQTAKKTLAVAAPVVSKTVNLNGQTPDESVTFEFVIEAVEPKNAPLPTPATASWTYDPAKAEESGTGTFGDVTFDALGTYQYLIRETPGTAEGWWYDAAEYLWTVTVARSATDTGLVATSTLVRKVVQDDAHPEGTETVDKAAFVNSYQNEGPLTIVKSDSTDHGKRLSGATFSLYSDASCSADKIVTVYSDEAKTNPITSFTTAGENGEITVYGLKPGKYYLKESTAPTGYCLIDGALEISVEKDKVTAQNVPGRIEADNNGGVLKVIVYDSPIYDIPSTGGRGTWMFHAAGLALMLLAAAFTATRRRERGSGAKR